MFRNYLKTAWRNLLRNKLYGFINIGGLAVGIAVCLLITLYVTHEYSYDQFHKQADRIYTVYARSKGFGATDSFNFPGTSYQAGPSLLRTDPAVEGFLRTEISFTSGVPVQNPASPGKRFIEHFLFADSNFFSFFSFQLKEGHPGTVLERPFTVVISERMAKKYFGNADPVGHLLKYDSAYTFEITGVAENSPSNSSIGYDFVASLSSALSMKGGSDMLKESGISIGSFVTRLLLKKGAGPAGPAATLKKLAAQQAAQNEGTWEASSRYYLLPLTATHLFFDGFDTSNTRYLFIFMLTGLFILLLALVNYISLATARATLRAKEIGVRKVTGASRKKIAVQFYAESALYAGIAFTAGMILFRLAQPYFFNHIQLSIDSSFIFQPRVLGIFAVLLLVTILVAGSYPSIVLSRFNPALILYGKGSSRQDGAAVRKLFIVIQFTIAVGMIICSLVIGRQMYFFRHTDTGLNRENVLMVPFEKSIRDHYQAFRNEVGQLSGIRETATAHYPMYEGLDGILASTDENKNNQPLGLLNVDRQFIPLLHIRWLLPPKDSSDHHGLIINETAIKQLGLPPDPRGAFIHIGSSKSVINGVVRDFNYEPLREKIKALALSIVEDSSTLWGAGFTGCLFVRIRPHVNLPTLIASVKKIYDRYDSKTAFRFEFMDDAFNAGYKAEDRLADIFSFFTGLTILIACLGLLGLAAFSTTQRVREIGIRKVLGASTRSIVSLLTKDFILYVFIAIGIAIPIAVYAMNQWLDHFAYRIHTGWGTCVLAASATIFIAIVTIGLIAFRAALANPVKNLRTE